ncbi:MAG TPA: NYN domain-containing protein [Candidatus Acidoferrum sp.]|nr:NYN domain-containing protein [Candidatus Acidoferrum sp.]
MALVRILVDGYSLLHGWPELAEGQPRYSPAARDELVQMLGRYADASSTPVTVVFDGSRPRRSGQQVENQSGVEILFSHSGQTADQIIERVTHRMKPYGEVLVVTDDHAERDTVIAFGGLAMSCDSFIRTLANTFGELDRDIERYNSREKRRYKQS